MHFTIVEKNSGKEIQAPRNFFFSAIRRVGGSHEWYMFIGTEAERGTEGGDRGGRKQVTPSFLKLLSLQGA